MGPKAMYSNLFYLFSSFFKFNGLMGKIVIKFHLSRKQEPHPPLLVILIESHRQYWTPYLIEADGNLNTNPILLENGFGERFQKI